MTAPTTLNSICDEEMISIDIPVEDFLNARYMLFNGKIDSLVGHPNYNRLRKIADEAMIHSYDPFRIISSVCQEFVSMVEKSTLSELEIWIDNM